MGGGGGASDLAGGGGGHTGGSGGSTEYGLYTSATSYNTGANQLNTDGANDATPNDGTVVIELLTPLPPTAICRPVTVDADGNCQGTAAAADFDGGSSDPNEDVLTYTVSPAGPYALGTTPVTLTVSDGEESASCETTITVVEDIDPVANVATLPTISGQCSATVSSAPTATDNCAGTVTGTTSDPLTYTEQGTYTITWTYDDGNGNTSMQTQTVIVDDTTAPTVSCSGGALYFNGEDSFPVTDAVTSSATDACGLNGGPSYAPAVITCGQVGQSVPVVVSYTDANGNVGRCTTSVQVNGLPCDFQDAGDIGCGDQAGYNPTSGTFTLQPSGCSNANPYSDQVGFLGYELCGNGSLSLRVASVSSPQVFAGIALRASLDPGAVKAEVFTNRTPTARAAVRSVPNGPAWPTTFSIGNRYWLKLERQGNQVRIYTSANGQTWTIQLVQNLPLPTCVQLGMVAYGPGTATFDNVVLNGGSLQTGPLQTSSEGGSLSLLETSSPPSTVHPPSLGYGGQGRQPSTVHRLPSTVLHLFPNPTTGPLTVELPADLPLEGAVLEVVDAYGRQLWRETALEARPALDLSFLPPGAYFVRLQTRDATQLTGRVVIQGRKH